MITNERITGGFTGSQADLKEIINYHIAQIIHEHSVSKKDATLLFCEALSKSLVCNEIENMVEYLLTGEIV